MTECYFDKLPNELLVQICANITDFDAAPPSAANFSLEPSAELTKSLNQPLKTLSLVCRRWRIVILPKLFRHACVALDQGAGWLRLCGGLSQYIKAHYKKTPKTLVLVKKIDELTETSMLDTSVEGSANRPLGFEYIEEAERIYPTEYFHWMPSLKGECEQFLEFLRQHDLERVVKSLAVYAHNDVTERRSSFEETILYNQVKSLWRQLFKSMTFDQIIIIAPPSTMATLAGCEEDTWDSWLFQMPYHYLKFAQNSGMAHAQNTTDGPPPSSPKACWREMFLYNVRPWTHMAYNEGTSLRAYSHYEYQWKKPPRVFPNLVKWLVREANSSQACMLQSVEYISLFPYVSHLRNFMLGLASFEHLRELKVKLANPDLLDNSDRMGKAQSSDVYNEWEHCYQLIGHQFLAVAKDGTVFISLDTKLPALKDQVRDRIERRSAAQLAHRLIAEEEDDVTKWRVAGAK